MEKIIEQRDGKKTRRKTYPEYLIKWKKHPMEDASWVTEPDILKHGKTVQESMNFFNQRSMMQEQRLQRRHRTCGGNHKTFQQRRKFKSGINSEFNWVVEIFC
jgi:hypothetical protein